VIAVQLYPQSRVERELRALGCERVEQIDSELSRWKTPWDFFFTVPELGDDKWCPLSAFHEILADIERTRPPTH